MQKKQQFIISKPYKDRSRLIEIRFRIVSKVLQDMDSFEKGMGTVLRNAWTHVEALQTTDIPLLVEYVTGVRLGGGGITGSRHTGRNRQNHQ